MLPEDSASLGPVVRDHWEAAAAAAAQVAVRVGLGQTRPRVLAVGWSLIVALEPLPVIARVSRAAGDRQRVSLAVQVDFASYAARCGGPVVPPLPGHQAGPHIQDGFVVTFWERVTDHPVTPDAVGRSLRRLHEAIAGFTGVLPGFDPRPEVRRIAGELPDTASETAVILRVGCDAVRWPDLPEQPLHGDAHLGNALGGPSGPLWNDFEYACVGPIEWDLASAAHQATVFSQNVDQTMAMLAGYGTGATERAMTLMDAVGLHAAAQTVAAMADRPDLQPQARRRLEWVQQHLGQAHVTVAHTYEGGINPRVFRGCGWAEFCGTFCRYRHRNLTRGRVLQPSLEPKMQNRGTARDGQTGRAVVCGNAVPDAWADSATCDADGSDRLGTAGRCSRRHVSGAPRRCGLVGSASTRDRALPLRRAAAC